MSQPSQSVPSVTANIAGAHHQVNLRDYLNIRVAPFIKKAITESLDASPEFPLQWLGENLIHQSMLYESNPDKTNIRERFLYSFEAPAPRAHGGTVSENSSSHFDAPAANLEQPSAAPESDTNGHVASEKISVPESHVNGEASTAQTQPEEQADTDMAGTS